MTTSLGAPRARADQPMAHNMTLLSHNELQGFGGRGEGSAMLLADDGRRILWMAHESAPKNFTGVDSPYEAPESPELRIDTTAIDPVEAAERIVAWLEGQEVDYTI